MTARSVAVIDDDRLVRATLKAILDDAGYRVTLAADAASAIEVINDENVEVVITDLLMPNGSGFEAIRNIRRRHPDMKIIAISGAIPSNGAALLDMLGALGADRVLAKPIEPDKIIETIEQLFPN